MYQTYIWLAYMDFLFDTPDGWTPNKSSH